MFDQGNYSVQFDGSIAFFSAYSDTTQYQQLLFSHTFDDPSKSSHFISLTAHLNGDGVRGRWLDFDFATIMTPRFVEPFSLVMFMFPHLFLVLCQILQIFR